MMVNNTYSYNYNIHVVIPNADISDMQHNYTKYKHFKIYGKCKKNMYL